MPAIAACTAITAVTAIVDYADDGAGAVASYPAASPIAAVSAATPVAATHVVDEVIEESGAGVDHVESHGIAAVAPVSAVPAIAAVPTIAAVRAFSRARIVSVTAAPAIPTHTTGTAAAPCDVLDFVERPAIAFLHQVILIRQ
jgi:hypothetical protein